MEKIIHQTWKTSELNEIEKECVESVKKAFDGYEYKFWVDEDNDSFISLNYPEFYDFYKKLVTVEKTHITRHLYIYHYGGVYLDLDVKMNRPLLLEGADMYLCDQTKEANIDKLDVLIEPFFLAGNKGCKYFYSICQSMVKGTFKFITPESIDKYNGILYRTGPYMVSKFYLLHKDEYKIKLLKDVFAAKRYEDYNASLDKFTAIHYQLSSWWEGELCNQ